MNGADWVIVAVVLLSTMQAAYAGFFQEAFHLAGLVAGYLLAAWQYQRVAGWLERYLKSAWLAESAGFLIIFFAVAVAAGMAGQTARWIMKKSGLSFVDRLLGGALGLLRGCLIVAVIVVSMTAFTPARSGWQVRSGLRISRRWGGPPSGSLPRNCGPGSTRDWICCAVCRRPFPAVSCPLQLRQSRKFGKHYWRTGLSRPAIVRAEREMP